ncbi:lysine methyltransferase [Metarhizium album ARSEF 1941]|uniref:Lysine methyltransferase n=1 Tax=Metarhizium album (strain ARSEF 1941) TaxID=1081103 RepID=A0A0B2WNG4_METAS|nr:lysine methyltransferase [Metarhizium album ARSEF 1941]KHN94545.1 lysine methyltransferase [Metarhizium album ARSEF 1941]
MSVRAMKVMLLLSSAAAASAASVCHAHVQLVKEPLGPAAQTRLHPLALAPFAFAPLDDGIGTNKANDSDGFSVYHSRDFARGRGISVVATASRAQGLERARPPDDANDFSSPPYEERAIPGKGRGLVATRMLHRGDRIFADTPVLLVDAEAYRSRDARWVALPHLAVDRLPGSTQDLFWDMHARPGGEDAVTGRIDPNSFEVEIDDGLYYAVFPEIAVSVPDSSSPPPSPPSPPSPASTSDGRVWIRQRINHDCRPNAIYYFDAETLTQRVHAVTDIAPGTELSVTYIAPVERGAERAAQLLRSWGFNCSCSACRQPSELAHMSDKRIAAIDGLVERLRAAAADDDDDDDEGWASAAAPQMAEALVSLYRQERLHGDMHEGLQLAALAHCAAGNYWDTVKYAHLAGERGALFDGPSRDDLARLARLAERPDGEDCWMRRRRARTRTSA